LKKCEILDANPPRRAAIEVAGATETMETALKMGAADATFHPEASGL